MHVENPSRRQWVGPRLRSLSILPAVAAFLAAAVCLRPWTLSRAALQPGRISDGSQLMAGGNEKPPTKKSGTKGVPFQLSYHDGKADGKKSLGGSGEIIAFTLPDADTMVTGIRIHGSRYGSMQPPKESFLIYFLNADMTELAAAQMAPYSFFKRSEDAEWVDVNFQQPIAVPKEFRIALDFRAARNKGVYVSYDTSTGGEHSKIGLPGMEAKDVGFGGDWMVEVLLAKRTK